eukprot:11327696-Alexandrium_andersonii.AAC.1
MATAPPHLRFGWSIDTKKAYENTHPALVLRVLRHWGIDEGIARALEAPWSGQCRWLSLAGGVHPQ